MTGLRRYGPLIAVVAMLFGAGFAATLATPQIHRAPLNMHFPTLPPQQVPLRTDVPTAPPVDPATLPPNQTGVPGWLAWLAQFLCVLAVAVALGVVVWFVRRYLRGKDGRPDEVLEVPVVPGREEVIAAVDAGLVELADDDADPRRAVIACWVRLEHAAAAAGTPRQPGDTPAELVTRLLAGHQVSAAVLYPLAEVYRLARYATHVVDAGMRDQARAALGQLRDELAKVPVTS
jgi:hypothetical protein